MTFIYYVICPLYQTGQVVKGDKVYRELEDEDKTFKIKCEEKSYTRDMGAYFIIQSCSFYDEFLKRFK